MAKASSLEGSDLQVVAPLYQEIVALLVRRSAGIQQLADLAGRRVLVGEAGSGTHLLARRILGNRRGYQLHC